MKTKVERNLMKLSKRCHVKVLLKKLYHDKQKWWKIKPLIHLISGMVRSDGKIDKGNCVNWTQVGGRHVNTELRD